MSRLAPAVVGVVLAAVACTSESTDEPEGPRRFEAVGTVVAIEGDFVLIDHEDIPGFMDAMTMSFPLEQESLLTGVEVGDRVGFLVRVENDASYRIERLEALE